MKDNTTTKILIAEDHPLFRNALRALILGDPSLEVVAETGDGRQVAALVEKHHPVILILDIALAGMTGLEVLRQLRDTDVPLKIIVLTMHKEEEMFNNVIDAGADGYVLKESAADVILESVKTVVNGQTYISPQLAQFLVARRRKTTASMQQHPPLANLTPAERKILKLVSENRTSKEIADILAVSEKTVENHRTNISNKLNLHGSNSLLKFAIEHRSAIALL